jgi:hypothetical protein
MWQTDIVQFFSVHTVYLYSSAKEQYVSKFCASTVVNPGLEVKSRRTIITLLPLVTEK